MKWREWYRPHGDVVTNDNGRCLKRAGQDVRLSKWRRWEKAAGRWQQWRWGLLRPLLIAWPSPASLQCPPQAIPCSFPPPALPRGTLRLSNIGLVLFPLRLMLGPSSPPVRSLKGSCLGDSFLSQMFSVSLNLSEPHDFPPSCSRRASASSFPTLSSAHVSSDARQHSFSLDRSGQ